MQYLEITDKSTHVYQDRAGLPGMDSSQQRWKCLDTQAFLLIRFTITAPVRLKSPDLHRLPSGQVL